MTTVTVISGKGGTGKTTVVSNLALLAEDLILADCDVDAPNLHLLLNPEPRQEKVFKSGKLAIKDEKMCLECGLCLEYCRFGAVSDSYVINSVKCEGCGLCSAVCPGYAINLIDQETGKIFISETRFGSMVHARLKPGSDNSGKLVSEVRKEADRLAGDNNKSFILVDGSPGIGCPVIASLNGVDMALIVTEPTRSGLSDLKRILQVTEHFDILSPVAVNKYDINNKLTSEIESYCYKNKIPFAGKIPFEASVNESLREGKILLEYDSNSQTASAIRDIWHNIVKIVHLPLTHS